MKKRYILVALGVISVLLGSLLYSNVISAQSGGEYDPWLDYNEDGIVDVTDLHSLGFVYGSSGDPTKNVNVGNWPTSRPITLWYEELVTNPDLLVSGIYNASGFGHLHMVVAVAGVGGGEEVLVNLYTCVWNYDHTSYSNVVAYSVTLNFSTKVDCANVPVPSEDFYFAVVPQAGTSCYVYMSFYLTWS